MVLCLVFCVAQGPEELVGVRLYPAAFSCASPMVLSAVEKNILVTELGQLLLCLPHAGPGGSVPLRSTKKQWRSRAPCPPLVPKTVLQVVAESPACPQQWELAT